MSIKEVFKPDWKKVVFALIILFALFLIPIQQTTVDFTGASRGLPFAFIKAGIANVPLPPGMLPTLSVDFIIWAFIADLIICYAAASIVVHALAKRKRV